MTARLLFQALSASFLGGQISSVHIHKSGQPLTKHLNVVILLYQKDYGRSISILVGWIKF
jgi:hypothetical protein